MNKIQELVDSKKYKEYYNKRFSKTEAYSLIEVIIQDNQMTNWKTLIFQLQDSISDNHILKYELSFSEFMSITDPRGCNMLNKIADYVFEGFRITEEYISRQEVIDYMLHTIYSSIIISKENTSVKEIDNTPEDIKEAIEINKKALEYTKDIKSKQVEIEDRKRKYYKKYWTLAEKSKAYLDQIYK